MPKAGRFEEKGRSLCRVLITLLADDAALSTPAGVGYAMFVVVVAWGLASPVIYGGRLLDRLLPRAREDEAEHACWGWDGQDPDPEVPAVVIDV